jgi:hypothetical protein
MFRGVFAKLQGSNKFPELGNYFCIEKGVKWVHDYGRPGLWKSVGTVHGIKKPEPLNH